MMLQAYVDDSGSEPQSLFSVLGGFIARSDRWAAFSDEWQLALHREPRIGYFKFNEAMGLKGQFDKVASWDDVKRDQKIDNLIDVILKYALARINATIRHDEFLRYFRTPIQVRSATVQHRRHGGANGRGKGRGQGL
jgi:hypothetical protein